MQLFVNKVLQSTQIKYIYLNVIFPILQNMEKTQVNEDLIFRPRSLANNEEGRKKFFLISLEVLS